MAADTIEDAKTAFNKLVKYQKTDDERSIDLFSKDCKVELTLTDGKRKQLAKIPTAAFLETIKKNIAEKKGNREKYEKIKFNKQDKGVLVTADIVYPDGKRGPFSALYMPDGDGDLLIVELNITVYVDK